MAHLISKTLLALGIAMAGASLCAIPAHAQETKTAAAKDVKAKPKAKAKSNAKSKKSKKAAIDPDAPVATKPEAEPDITNNKVVEYKCELGNVVSVYTNDAEADAIAVRWRKRLHRLTRVGTTTGAQRFENRNYGLVWIGIPSKGMLLDSKLNRQLANECKNAEQENPAMLASGAATPAAPAAAPAATAAATAAAAPAAGGALPEVKPLVAPSSAPAVPPAAQSDLPAVKPLIVAPAQAKPATVQAAAKAARAETAIK